MIDLDAIEARANAATAGPWEPETYVHNGVDGKTWFAMGPSHLITTERLASPEREITDWDGEEMQACKDATFMAAARSDVPTLCAEVRRLRELCGKAGKWIDEEEICFDGMHERQEVGEKCPTCTKRSALVTALLEAGKETR